MYSVGVNLMKKNIILFFSFILIAGCATEAKFQAILNTTMGLSEKQLVDKLGIPHRTYQLGATKYLTYEYSSSYYVPQNQSTYINGYGNYATANTYSYGGYTVNSRCNVTFTIERGVVVNWRYEGNGCKA